MSFDADMVVDWTAFSHARAEMGAGIVRLLGYFREDGIKSVAAVEHAARSGDATAMVIPAHTLKGGARHFGAQRLSKLAETIERIARDCIESHETPTLAVEHVVRLRPLFEETLAELEREANPLVVRRGFGTAAPSRMGA